MHDGRGKNHQADLWQYSRPAGAAVFDFRMGREQEGPKRFLGNFEGILQCDGYGAYDHVGGPKIVLTACWAHARRKFFETVKLNPKDQTSIRIVAQMDLLSAIDEKARAQKLTQSDRHLHDSKKRGRCWSRLKRQSKRHGCSVLPGLGDFPIGRIAELTPTEWADRN